MAVSGTNKRQVALADRFLEGFIRLPQKIQTRVRAQLDLLYDNPGHPSLNYETIKNAGDPRMRSVRVTDDYRLIVAHPNGNGTYLVLWVDKHDVAYDWAMRHRLDPGDEDRGLAIVPLSEREEAASTQPSQPVDAIAAPSTSVPAGSVLAHCTDDQLIKAGVSALLLPGLRACVSTDALLDALGALRAEVAENVMCLALGEPVIDTSHELDASDETTAIPQINETASATDVIEIALHKPESSRRFVVLSSQHELEQALNYPMERWRLFLHPDQRAIVTRHFAGPALVSGGAGTGKTVVGLHRALYLASKVFTAPEDRILVTTFTHNLAANLSQLVDSLCGADHSLRERIDVASVHSVATKIRR